MLIFCLNLILNVKLEGNKFLTGSVLIENTTTFVKLKNLVNFKLKFMSSVIILAVTNLSSYYFKQLN